MNILDENIRTDQRAMLRAWRIPTHQIGQDLAGQGIQDENIIPVLLRLRRPTFFTWDSDFYRRRLCHRRYCLVFLDVDKLDVALYVRRVLRHPSFDTQAKRMGAVVRATPTGLVVWRLHAEREERHDWP